MNFLSIFVLIPVLMIIALFIARNRKQVLGIMVTGSTLLVIMAVYLTVSYITDRAAGATGPNPFTKEQAILMMADSVEAASRSLPEYTEESISALVEKIIDSQVQDGYFKECPITFKDISTVKSVSRKS